MATSKAYIGSGKPTKYEGVIVTLRMEEAQKHVRTGQDGQQWLSFIVSSKQKADEKGRTHNAFVLVGEPDAEPAVNEMKEPATETPEGSTVERNGRKLKRISKADAARMSADQQD